MTKKEFIKKYSDFTIDGISTNMFLECCYQSQLKESESTLFLDGKMYNHGFYQNHIHPTKLEHDWDILSSNKQMLEYLMKILNGNYFSSERIYPYRPFMLTNFQYEKGNFLQDFFNSVGLTLKCPKGKNASYLYDEVQLESIPMNQSIFMLETPHEQYYSENCMKKYLQAERYMKIYLKNIRRISFHKSSKFSGMLPIFFLGETLKGNSLVGLFSIGEFNTITKDKELFHSLTEV